MVISGTVISAVDTTAAKVVGNRFHRPRDAGYARTRLCSRLLIEGRHMKSQSERAADLLEVIEDLIRRSHAEVRESRARIKHAVISLRIGVEDVRLSRAAILKSKALLSGLTRDRRNPFRVLLVILSLILGDVAPVCASLAVPGDTP